MRENSFPFFQAFEDICFHGVRIRRRPFSPQIQQTGYDTILVLYSRNLVQITFTHCSIVYCLLAVSWTYAARVSMSPLYKSLKTKVWLDIHT